MRYGGLKILSEKRQKGKNCIKTFQNTPHIVHMGHTTEKKCPFDDYFTSLPSITLFQQKRATDQKLCPFALYKDLSTYLSR